MNEYPQQTVLIVDDDRVNRMILAQVLQNECQVVLAKDGASAMQQARNNRDISLILLDVTMPEMDGYEVLESLKSDESTSRIPVVFITGHTEEEEEEHGLVRGAIDYVFKPVRPAIVRARIRNLLKMIAQGKELARLTGRDAQTALFTRVHFEEALARLCRLAQKTETNIAVAFVEIDGFAQYVAGHSSSEASNLIYKIAYCISDLVRHPLELAARYSEDRFVILLPEALEATSIFENIRQLVLNLEIPVESSDSSASMSVSIGSVVTNGAEKLRPELFFQAAETALADARTRGGNCVVISDTL